MSKKWSGLAKEYFTDADNFGVQCKPVHGNTISQLSSFIPLSPNVVPMDLDVKMKAVVLAATFLIVSH